MKLVYLLVFCTLVLSVQVIGVGISGDLDMKTVFKPDSDFSFYFTGLANHGTTPLDHEITTDGDISQYTTFEKTFFPGLVEGDTVPIKGTIRFPSELEPPQKYMKLCLLTSCASKGTVCGRAAACVMITILVPYEGIYPQASINAENVNENEPVTFNVGVKNLGEDTIQKCSGDVTILNLERKTVGKALLTDTEYPINSYLSANMGGEFDTTGLKPGNYSAIAELNCDGTKTSANTTFRIGDLEVRIIDFTTELRQGGIQKFQTKVESFWNDPLEIDASVRVYDNAKSITGDTPTKRLDPWDTMNLDTFIDTSSLEAKEYDVDITVKYADSSSSKKGKVRIVPSEEMPFERPVEEYPEKEGISTTTLTIILVIVVILLTAVNVFLAVYRKKKE